MQMWQKVEGIGYGGHIKLVLGTVRSLASTGSSYHLKESQPEAYYPHLREMKDRDQ